jgi:hypothetical protein
MASRPPVRPVPFQRSASECSGRRNSARAALRSRSPKFALAAVCLASLPAGAHRVSTTPAKRRGKRYSDWQRRRRPTEKVTGKRSPGLRCLKAVSRTSRPALLFWGWLSFFQASANTGYSRMVMSHLSTSDSGQRDDSVLMLGSAVLRNGPSQTSHLRAVLRLESRSLDSSLLPLF